MPQSERTCGSCTACCHSLVIEELDKPAFRDCPNQCGTSGGCGAYHDRPTSCRDFRCLWLDGHLDENDRPDKLGAIFTTTHDNQVGVHPLIVEATPGGTTTPPVRQAIERLTTKSPVLVLTPNGGTFHPRPRNTPRPRKQSPQAQKKTPLTIDGQAA